MLAWPQPWWKETDFRSGWLAGRRGEWVCWDDSDEDQSYTGHGSRQMGRWAGGSGASKTQTFSSRGGGQAGIRQEPGGQGKPGPRPVVVLGEGGLPNQHLPDSPQPRMLPVARGPLSAAGQVSVALWDLAPGCPWGGGPVVCPFHREESEAQGAGEAGWRSHRWRWCPRQEGPPLVQAVSVPELLAGPSHQRPWPRGHLCGPGDVGTPGEAPLGVDRAGQRAWGRGQEAQVRAGNSRRSPNSSCPELSGRASVLSLLNKHVMNLKVRAETCPRRKNSHLATESAPSSPLVPSLALPEARAPPPHPGPLPGVGAGLAAPGVWE